MALAKRFEHAENACRENSDKCATTFSNSYSYQVCYTRLGNKARYAFESVECYSYRIAADKAELSEKESERLVETEKWYLIASLSVIEYSMPALLNGRGSRILKNAAREGPFGVFLRLAEAEGAMGDSDRVYLEFLMRVRNDILHRNAVSRVNASLSYAGRIFELKQGEMLEGHWGMLADLGALAAHSVSSVINHIEANCIAIA